MESDKRPSVKTVAPPKPIEGALALLVKARPGGDRCGRPFAQPINPAVLPAELMKNELRRSRVPARRDQEEQHGSLRETFLRACLDRRVGSRSTTALEVDSGAVHRGARRRKDRGSHRLAHRHRLPARDARLRQSFGKARGLCGDGARRWVVEGAKISFLGHATAASESREGRPSRGQHLQRATICAGESPSLTAHRIRGLASMSAVSSSVPQEISAWIRTHTAGL
jgi:hypothetical protein